MIIKVKQNSRFKGGFEVAILLGAVIGLSPFFNLSKAAESLVEKTLTLQSNDRDAATAKRNIQNLAIVQASEDLVRDMVGEEKYQKLKKQVENKVYRQYVKYIPFITQTNVEPGPEGFKSTVVLKISLNNLKTMLQDNGFLVETEGAGVILPLINVVDRVNLKAYRWWQPSPTQNNAFFVEIEQILESELKQSFFKNNFYVMKPLDARLYQQIPLEHQNERPSSLDLNYLGKSFNAPFAILGQVTLNLSDSPQAYKVEIKMDVMQISSGRVLANVMRKFETDSGIFEQVVAKKIRSVFDSMSSDLATQVKDVWQKGAVGAHPLLLVLHGHTPIPWQEQLKDQIRLNIPQIKSVYEKSIFDDQVIYELNTNMSLVDFSKRVESLKVVGHELLKESIDSEKVTFRFKKIE